MMADLIHAQCLQNSNSHKGTAITPSPSAYLMKQTQTVQSSSRHMQGKLSSQAAGRCKATNPVKHQSDAKQKVQSSSSQVQGNQSSQAVRDTRQQLGRAGCESPTKDVGSQLQGKQSSQPAVRHTRQQLGRAGCESPTKNVGSQMQSNQFSQAVKHTRQQLGRAGCESPTKDVGIQDDAKEHVAQNEGCLNGTVRMQVSVPYSS